MESYEYYRKIDEFLAVEKAFLANCKKKKKKRDNNRKDFKIQLNIKFNK